MLKGRPISVFLLIFSLALFSCYHIYYYFVDKVNNNLVDNYFEKDILDTPNIASKIKEDKVIGFLEIPSLNFKKELYDKNSSQNNVNKNIEILKESSMPDVPGGAFILAAHSGNSYLGFFKNIHKLKIGENINIYYLSKKYSYIINDIYNLEKNGQIEINKALDDNYLVLTTCHDNGQLVITAINKTH